MARNRFEEWLHRLRALSPEIMVPLMTNGQCTRLYPLAVASGFDVEYLVASEESGRNHAYVKYKGRLYDINGKITDKQEIADAEPAEWQDVQRDDWEVGTDPRALVHKDVITFEQIKRTYCPYGPDKEGLWAHMVAETSGEERDYSITGDWVPKWYLEVQNKHRDSYIYGLDHLLISALDGMLADAARVLKLLKKDGMAPDWLWGELCDNNGMPEGIAYMRRYEPFIVREGGMECGGRTFKGLAAITGFALERHARIRTNILNAREATGIRGSKEQLGIALSQMEGVKGLLRLVSRRLRREWFKRSSKVYHRNG